MRELRAEAMRKCELALEEVKTVAEGLQRTSDSLLRARKLLGSATSALDIPTPCTAIDIREGVGRLDRHCARIEVLVQLAADAEIG